MPVITRRNLLTSSALSFAAASYNRISGSNDRVHVGFIGTGGMGRANLAACKNQTNTDISWVCDVYEPNLQKALKLAPVARYSKDFRWVLDSKTTDAVCISTPDHWHALMTAEAFKSGKDVYCEKPIAHRVNEIKKIVEAGKKNKRVFQSGQWQHSGNQFLHAIESLRKKEVGKIINVNTWFFSGTGSMGNPQDSPPPPDLDWNMWLGPAPYRNFNSNRFLFNFRWFWDYANGMFGDWLPHMTDIAEWGMRTNELKQKNEGPFSVRATGEPTCVDDNRETPTNFHVEYDFGKKPQLIADYNGCSVQVENRAKKRDWGIEWTCQGGSIFVDRDICLTKDPQGKIIREVKNNGKEGNEHWRDFIECVKSRKETRASLNQVARTNLNCLLAAAAYRYGKPIKWDPKNMWADTLEAQKYLEYNYRAPWKLEI